MNIRSLPAATCTLLLQMLCGCGFIVFTPEETPPDAEETARRMVTCLHLGSVDEAKTLLAFEQGGSKEAIQASRSFLQDLADQITSGRKNLSVLEVQTSGQTAVAILRLADTSPNPRSRLIPMYLLKTEGRWKISPDWPSYQPLLPMKPALAPTWRDLEQWSRGRIETLNQSSANAK